MRAVLAVLAVSVAVVAAVPAKSTKIVGGTVTTISSYPYAVALLYSWTGSSYSQSCGGTILTSSAILTAAHCVYGDSTINWRGRVGSSYASSGGTVHSLRSISVHPSFNYATLDNDVAVLRTSSSIVYSNNVGPASIAGTSYNLPDNSPVYAIGWGTTSTGGYLSEQLRHVQIWSVNQSVCRSRYSELGYSVSDNMLCSGWLDVGGRDQCQGDSGGPLIHNNVIVGICSWGNQCALPRYPGVNTRVSNFTNWIQNAAN